MTQPSLQQCTLADGRQLAYAEYGASDGVPAFYFHGTTSSRLEGALYDAAARKHGVRLITVDRPGTGHSDPLPARTLLDWPQDIVELSSHLKLARFAVAGGSGGGPHALACAQAIPERLTGVVLINTAVPPIARYWKSMPAPMRLMRWLYCHFPDLARYLSRKMAASRDPQALRDEKRYAKMRRFLNEGDQRVMDDTQRRLIFADAVCEGLRQDPLFFATEAELFLGKGENSWGFDVKPLSTPVIALCGREDGSDLFAKELLSQAPAGSDLKYFNGGHISALGEEASELSMTALASFR